MPKNNINGLTITLTIVSRWETVTAKRQVRISIFSFIHCNIQPLWSVWMQTRQQFSSRILVYLVPILNLWQKRFVPALHVNSGKKYCPSSKSSKVSFQDIRAKIQHRCLFFFLSGCRCSMQCANETQMHVGIHKHSRHGTLDEYHGWSEVASFWRPRRYSLAITTILHAANVLIN